MRISDWSSDVCSSDLLLELALVDPHRIEIAAVQDAQLDALAQQPAQQARQLRQLVGQNQHLRPQGLLARERQELADQVGGPVGVLPIGRASCRERVGKYGEV